MLRLAFYNNGYYLLEIQMGLAAKCNMIGKRKEHQKAVIIMANILLLPLGKQGECPKYYSLLTVSPGGRGGGAKEAKLLHL